MLLSGMPELRPVRRRLQQAHDLQDIRQVARRRTPRSIFDYVDGAADNERAAERNLEAFRSVEFLPQVLRNVGQVDPSTTILGRPSALPLIFGPTGFTRMMNHEGEIAVGRVAERNQIPYALSTMGTTSPEQLAEAAPNLDRWFQLYMWRDRDASRALVDRARESGFGTIMLTIDVPVAGARLRDRRNGMTMPPSLNLQSFAGIVRHPNWWINALTTDPLKFAAFDGGAEQFMELTNRMFDPQVTFEDLRWLRKIWPGKIVVKGILNQADAQTVIDCGADAIVVSNHGGRQLDNAAAPLKVLPGIRSALGNHAEIYLDSGVRSGVDMAAAIALGANAVMIGRPYLYGIMAGGEQGVQRVTQIFDEGFRRTMALLGAARVQELGPHLLYGNQTQSRELDSVLSGSQHS